MINLLPPIEKQKLFSEKKQKLTIIFVVVFLVSLVCLILVLLSIKFYIMAETDLQKNILEQNKKENQTSEIVSLNSIIQKYNGIFTQLSSFYEKEIYFNKVLDVITNISTPSDVYLTDFSLNRDKKGIVNVNISGISGTRDNLLLYKKSIEENTKIKNPSFSAESWVSPKDVAFSLIFTIDQNEN